MTGRTTGLSRLTVQRPDGPAAQPAAPAVRRRGLRVRRALGRLTAAALRAVGRALARLVARVVVYGLAACVLWVWVLPAAEEQVQRQVRQQVTDATSAGSGAAKEAAAKTARRVVDGAAERSGELWDRTRRTVEEHWTGGPR